MSFLKSLGKVMSLGMDPKDLLKGGAAAGAAALLGTKDGAGAAILGPLLGSGLSAWGANEATKKQLDWERERALNAHQWEVQDLQAAGLNPILSAGGSGATTGGISAPVPDFSGISTLGNAIQAAAATKNLGEQNLNLQADRDATKAQTALTLETVATQRQKTITEMKNQGLIDAQTAKFMTDKNFTQVEMQKLAIEIEYKKQQMQAEIDKLQAEAEQLKANKKYTQAKAKETEANTIKTNLENKAFWWNFAGSIAKGLSEEGRGWVNTGINALNTIVGKQAMGK